MVVERPIHPAATVRAQAALAVGADPEVGLPAPMATEEAVAANREVRESRAPEAAAAVGLAMAATARYFRKAAVVNVPYRAAPEDRQATMARPVVLAVAAEVRVTAVPEVAAAATMAAREATDGVEAPGVPAEVEVLSTVEAIKSTNPGYKMAMDKLPLLGRQKQCCP